MKIFSYNGTGGATSDESQFTRLSASVNNGEATIHRYLFFEAESPNEDAADILGLTIFPQKNSAHPLHPSFKYYGNAQISPVTNSKKYWMADLEYSSSDPNAKDADGNKVTQDTKPWKLKPTAIHFSYPENTVAFTAAYNSNGNKYDKDGNVLVPVVNSAGDPFAAETSVRDLQLGFTFATQNWDPGEAMQYANSINSKEIKVVGITIPAFCGLLMPPECSYVTVYEENSTNIKWQYWNVTINILLNYSGTRMTRRLLDVGDRARFAQINLSGDKMLSDAGFPNQTLAATPVASQICHFRLTEKIGNEYIPAGKLIFCSWDQYLQARKIYLNASTKLQKINKDISIYELQCEQDTQMPLAADGTLFLAAIQGTAEYKSDTKYRTRTFREFPQKDWKRLNLPKKGIDW